MWRTLRGFGGFFIFFFWGGGNASAVSTPNVCTEDVCHLGGSRGMPPQNFSIIGCIWCFLIASKLQTLQNLGFLIRCNTISS